VRKNFPNFNFNMHTTTLIGEALFSPIEISGSLGLIATVVLTCNMVLGMMLSTSFVKTYWGLKLPAKIKAVDVNNLHNYTAYVALLLVFAHIILIPLDPSSKFNFIDIVWPANAPHQSNIVFLGTFSLIALITVIITTQKVIQRKLGFGLWKKIHLISYTTCILFVAHGLLMDPLLKDRPTDWIDAEKLLSEICGLVLLIAFILRYKYHLNSKKSV
jgi:sulfoxide reductase heme-binding subunit YedZ